MEFTFEVRDILVQDITKITNSLIPPNFAGDRRKLCLRPTSKNFHSPQNNLERSGTILDVNVSRKDTQNKLSDIINVMGEASASAQGLTKPITTADRLKNSDHQLYLLVDHGGRQGAGRVVGMLKTGRKGLYIFDRAGEHYQLHPICILDFYVHEACQRMGLGKRLFEHMLQEEGVQPVKLAIDRPSEKFLGFLKKHYSLDNPIPQMNNFVVFDGFFPEKGSQSPRRGTSPYRTNNNRYCGILTNSCSSPNAGSNKQNGFGGGVPSQYGRYAAPRPVCSMGQIIHNHSAAITPEHSRCEPLEEKPFVPYSTHLSPKLERPRSLSINTEDTENDIEIRIQSEEDYGSNKSEVDYGKIESQILKPDQEVENITLAMNNGEKPCKSKQHVICNQHYSTENNIFPAGKSPTERISRTPSNLTEQGFIDLKFYHSRLW